MPQDLAQLVRDASSDSITATRSAARLMTVMTDQPDRMAELLRGAREWPQPKMVLGITGAPGSGKSTLTDHLAAEYRARFPDRRLGIIAVDPSSPFTGGALLGDRVRMMRHATDPKIFIRSLASRGHLGGLALGAKGVARVMGLIGCDVVLIETVGVGQSEVEIASNADLTMVVLAPGQGDSIQMLKAGLMEAGDLFVVNKADREGANQLYTSLLSALQMESMALQELFGSDESGACLTPSQKLSINGHTAHVDAPPRASDDEDPEVFLVSAANHTNIKELVDGLESMTARYHDQWREERQQQVIGEIQEAALAEVRKRMLKSMKSNPKSVAKVLAGEWGVTELAVELMSESLSIARQQMLHAPRQK